MSATSTHDTKRAEDNRARLNTLSEVADEWASQVDEWREIGRALKLRIGDVPAPDDDDEYYIYQTLLGALPEVDGNRIPEDLLPRAQASVEKALREAKRHTAWINVNAEYEEATRVFVSRLLDPTQPFLQKLLAFANRLLLPGYWSSLSQLVVKATAPGVPDFFQGTELWDFSMVDPDNRRPVDFALRQRLVAELASRTESDRAALIAELSRAPGDGRIKLFLTQALLTCRRRNRDIFLRGSYEPLRVQGARQDNIIAFARQWESAFAVTIAGRFFTKFGTRAGMPRKDDWGDTTVRWPSEIAPTEAHDAVAGVVRRIDGADVRIADLFDAVPFCVLVGKTSASPKRS
jgi:(1->4)-alpha-D-glucan 1-alpha-D-glucosylmutase